MKIKERGDQLKVDIATIYLALKDKQTPFIAKVFAMITICYALSPIDLIPDFIPILGYVDDIILLPIFLWITCRCIPDDIYQRNQQKAKQIWKEGRPKKWIYAIPIITIWILVVIWLLYML